MWLMLAPATPGCPSQPSCSSASTQVRGLADCYGLRVHMDGARLMNAAVAQDMEPAHITQHCDSVSLCFSKVCSHREGVPRAHWGLALIWGLSTHLTGGGTPGQKWQPPRAAPVTALMALQGLGAPAGAVLAGRREFVDEAWRARKLLGGGMRQAGVLAAAARVGLRHMEATLRRDHNNARRFAEGILGPLGTPVPTA